MFRAPPFTANQTSATHQYSQSQEGKVGHRPAPTDSRCIFQYRRRCCHFAFFRGKYATSILGEAARCRLLRFLRILRISWVAWVSAGFALRRSQGGMGGYHSAPPDSRCIFQDRMRCFHFLRFPMQLRSFYFMRSGPLSPVTRRLLPGVSGRKLPSPKSPNSPNSQGGPKWIRCIRSELAYFLVDKETLHRHWAGWSICFLFFSL